LWTATHPASTATCSTCHLSQRPSSHTANPSAYPTTCQSCHKYPTWAATAFTHSSTTTNCQSCHLAKYPVPHSQYNTRFGTVCEKCHTYPVWATYKSGSFNHTAFSVFPTSHKGYSRCIDCHPASAGGYASKGGCIQCHTAKGEKVHKVSTNAGCLSCHPRGN